MTLLFFFFEVKAVIEEHYERRIEFYKVSTRRCHGRRNVNWGSGREKSEGDNGDALSKFFNEKFLSEEK